MTEQQQAAMALALDAIAASGDFLFNWHDCEPNNEREMSGYQEVMAMNEKAFTALRRALEQQPADEPCAIRHSFDGYGWKYVDMGFGGSWRDWAKRYPDAEFVYDRPQPAAPVIDESAAKRIATTLGWKPAAQWVGLTDEELCHLFEEYHDCYGQPINANDNGWAYERAIEVKLRSKNGSKV